ncbi:unnamed protein product [Amaranthus hypochondriacus]
MHSETVKPILDFLTSCYFAYSNNLSVPAGKVDDATKVQTLLFSATLPDWVKQISTRFLKAAKKTVE